MAAPSVKVVFAFDQDAGGSTNFFTLDDTVKGVLDNTTYTLGGDFSLVDVTAYVRAVSVNRGRSRILDKVQSGSANILLDNRLRLFDPTAGTAVSPYANSIVPRKNVTIAVNDEPVFTGLVDDWNLDYSPDNDNTTGAVCADGFVQLAQVNMPTTVQTAQLSGARITNILDVADWPTSKRNIDTGAVTLQADTPSGSTNVIDYISTISDTEFGVFYMSRDGLATFEDRNALQNFGTATLFGGTGIPISGVQIDYGTEQLYNQVTAVRQSGGTAVATDAESQTKYGISELTKSGLLFDDDTELGELADYLLSLYKNPTFRITSVDVVMNGLTTAQQATVARLDISDPVEVTFTPSVGSAITQFGIVDRIQHNATPAAHRVTLSLSQAQPSFILDSSVFGVLDDDVLGF